MTDETFRKRNPLDPQPIKSYHVKTGIEMLEEHLRKLNNMNFVAGSGRPYFIASRTKPDGEVERYLDRRA